MDLLSYEKFLRIIPMTPGFNRLNFRSAGKPGI
jgi:hypothetical protein